MSRMLQKLDKLMIDAKDIYQDVQKEGFDEKTQDRILSNLMKAWENMLVAEKRIKKAKDEG